MMQAVKALLRHSKIQVPLVKLRSAISDLWRALFAMSGRFRPFSAEDLETCRGEAAPFSGDIPLNSGDELCQYRLYYKKPRPPFIEVDNLIVTPRGGGWKNGALHERYSSMKPGLRMLLEPHAPARTISDGVFVQSEHIDTFGDWTSEYLAPLARAGLITAPLLLPARMASRPYVIRDAARLSMNIIAIDEPTLIERATLVPQPKVVRSWTPLCVSKLREALGVEISTPAPGSMLYLSRYGEASEVANRTHPNYIIEDIVRQRGGAVLRTGSAGLEDYLNAARHVETLLFDHGSAAYNIVYWQPRRIIEFVSDDWWMNSFLFFTNAVGIKDYSIIRSDLGAVAERVNAVLDAPIIE